MASTYRTFNSRKTSQKEAIPGSDQVPNSAGGYAWKITPWEQLDRFLVLGTEGGTYYIEEKQLTKENASSVLNCIKEDGPRVVSRITEISDQGRAPSNDPAIFALALCFGFGDDATKAAARAALPKVCRIGTHLFHFTAYAEQFRGWGSSLKKAVGAWYTEKSPTQLADQLLKYQQRDGWSHRDLLILSHPKTISENHKILFDYVLGARPGHDGHVGIAAGRYVTPGIEVVYGFERAKTLPDTAEGLRDLLKLIETFGLQREMIPTHFLTKKEVWEALLPKMGSEALIRNLGTMTKIGLLTPFSDATRTVMWRLSDHGLLQKQRVHPMSVLLALKTYAQGSGHRSDSEWKTVPQIVDALDGAFYGTFKSVEPTGLATMLALDVSGSMGSPITLRRRGKYESLPITYRDASAAIALITANVEPNWMAVGFTEGSHPTKWGSRYNASISELNISPRQRLDDVVKYIAGLPFGGTDCALPMLYATEKDLKIDAFAVYTDNETWAGDTHPSQALRQYREKSGKRNAKVAVVSMEANSFSIADPFDPGMLDVVGFDTNTPSAIAEFFKSSF